MSAMLALHTWTLETTPLADALRATKAAGWDGVELRRVDFARAAEKGQTADAVLALVKASGLGVACVGVELGWMFADGDERRKLMQAFDESCRWAVALAEIAYVQYSDVPRTGLEPGKALDRLPPGRGSVPFKEIFALLERKGYRGFMSYEAPNPAAWARPAEEVAREALEATRAQLPARR